MKAGTRARDAAPIMHERVVDGRSAPDTCTLRATPELAKLTTTRTGPPRSPQLLAALATVLIAATRSERLGRPALEALLPLERAALPEPLGVEVPVLGLALAPFAPASGRSVTDTVGMPELDVKVVGAAAPGSQAGAGAGVAAATCGGVGGAAGARGLSVA